jgi:hypothetical protein
LLSAFAGMCRVFPTPPLIPPKLPELAEKPR